MTYSIDLRERVVSYVRGGGRKTSAVKLFGVGRDTIYRWLSTEDLRPKAYERKKARKLDLEALRRHVVAHPQMMAKDRASHFGVHPTSIIRALRRLRITRKKLKRDTANAARNNA